MPLVVIIAKTEFENNIQTFPPQYFKYFYLRAYLIPNALKNQRNKSNKDD